MCSSDNPSPEQVPFPRLIVGLGNPGPQYRKTRHNLGFLVTDLLVEDAKLGWTEDDSSYRATAWDGEDGSPVYLQPLTYMNRSGEAIVRWLEMRGLEPDLSRILVICDDLALPLGVLRLRGKGSSGGQNGLLSIIEELESEAFARLRLGIDGTEGALDPEEWPDYVLAPFSAEEQEMAGAMVQQAVQAVRAWSEQGVERASSRFNGMTEI